MTNHDLTEHNAAGLDSGADAVDMHFDRVAMLAAYDELLKQGRTFASTLAGTTTAAGLAPELVECLELIEQVWPRGSERPGALAALPESIGRFKIQRLLGQGGFGIVYLARDPLLDREVALKVPRLHALASEGIVERFRREARATAALDHPNIVPIHETGEAGPLCYIAFAYCEGPSLAQWLKMQAGNVPARVAAEIVGQLAEAMQYSHSRGVLHRDLKPSNVLLFPARERAEDVRSRPFVPRIVDFGLARLAEEEIEATGTSAVIGTPLYMAPEQAIGPPAAVGAAADIYALGVILYELLCGRPPFVGTAPLIVLDQVRNEEPPGIRKQRSDVPQDLETICLKCLQKRPEDRYESAQGLADDLKRFLAGQDVVARPVSMRQRVARWCRQPQRLREGGLTFIAVTLATSGWAIFTSIAIAWGWIPRPDHMSYFAGFQHSLPTVVFVAPTLVFVGWSMMRGKLWAIQLGLGTGIGMTILAVLLSLNWVSNPYSWLWNDLPGMSMLIYSMLAALCLLQTLASAVAWIAHNRAR